MKLYLIFILVMAFVSCDNGNEVQINNVQINNVFEVTVGGVGIDCKLVLIDFQEKDLKRIEAITGSNWGRYQAFNLDKKFNQAGQVLIVTVRKTADNELFACTMLGPTYPWVTVLKAEEKNNIISVAKE